jgi:hypothetical protein
MTRRLPWIAGLLMVLGTGVEMYLDSTWVGEWDETGSALGVRGGLGGLLAALVLAVDARRNWRPMLSLRLPATTGRLLASWCARVVLPAMVGWIVIVIVCYAITYVVAPHPSSISAWPILAATLFILITVVVGFLAGLVLHPAIALPTVGVIAYLAPSALGAIEPSWGANFTTSTSTSLAVGFLPVPGFYVRQCAFFVAVVLLLGALCVGLLRHRIPVVAVAVSAVLVLGSGIWVGVSGTERIKDASGLTASTCTTLKDGIEVCMLSDHQRFLATTADAVGRVTSYLPEDARPARYVETGLDAGPNDAVLAAYDLPIDPMSEVIGDTADWHTCENQDTDTRSDWLEARLHLTGDDFPDEDVHKILTMSDKDQLAWWRDGLHREC